MYVQKQAFALEEDIHDYAIRGFRTLHPVKNVKRMSLLLHIVHFTCN